MAPTDDSYRSTGWEPGLPVDLPPFLDALLATVGSIVITEYPLDLDQPPPELLKQVDALAAAIAGRQPSYSRDRASAQMRSKLPR